MTAELSELMLVASGGALGGMGRLALGNAVTRRLGAALPWGTLVVNVSGALAMGGLAGAAGSTLQDSAWLLLAVGGLGGYTTVSSLSLQVLTLWQQRRRGAALGYGLGTLAAGLGGVGLGAGLAGGLT